MANTKALKLINIARRYKHIKPVPRMPNFAAWIEGVDLTQPLSAPVQAELRRALFDFEVIFFPPQVISPAQHVALAQVFGPVSAGSFFDRKPGAPELEMIAFDREHPPSIDNWHTDISWKARPPIGTTIQITVTPPAGGNTCWISTSKAYDWLSLGMQKYLEGLTAVHSWEVSGIREGLGQRGDEALIAAIQAFKPVVHPVVRKNPDSGRKCIFVNADFTRHIQGVDRLEARGMLQFLLEWMKKPEFMVHHPWRAHEIAVWDNRSTQHYALADYWPHQRVNQRVTFDEPGMVSADTGAVTSVNDQVVPPTGIEPVSAT
jgi:taurine dioxygenase